MPRRSFAAALAGLAIIAVPITGALAHAVCGNRVFPATLTLDDPGVADELSLPTIQYTPISGGGSVTSYGFEWDKTITPSIGFGIQGGYVVQHLAGANAQGWDNLAATPSDRNRSSPHTPGHSCPICAAMAASAAVTATAPPVLPRPRIAIARIVTPLKQDAPAFVFAAAYRSRAPPQA